MAVTKVEAEVTGKVWKVVSVPGQQLRAEDPIVIVESMKMEIPVMAPKAGVLSRVLVNEGDAFFRPAGLNRQDAEHVKRLEVAGIAGENFPIDLFGLL